MCVVGTVCVCFFLVDFSKKKKVPAVGVVFVIIGCEVADVEPTSANFISPQPISQAPSPYTGDSSASLSIADQKTQSWPRGIQSKNIAQRAVTRGDGSDEPVDASVPEHHDEEEAEDSHEVSEEQQHLPTQPLQTPQRAALRSSPFRGGMAASQGPTPPDRDLELHSGRTESSRGYHVAHVREAKPRKKRSPPSSSTHDADLQPASPADVTAPTADETNSGADSRLKVVLAPPPPPPPPLFFAAFFFLGRLCMMFMWDRSIVSSRTCLTAFVRHASF